MRLEPSWRQLAGIAIILTWIAVWSAIVVSAAVIVAERHWGLQALYFIAAGLAWIVPLRPLLRWMETGEWRE